MRLRWFLRWWFQHGVVQIGLGLCPTSAPPPFSSTAALSRLTLERAHVCMYTSCICLLLILKQYKLWLIRFMFSINENRSERHTQVHKAIILCELHHKPFTLVVFHSRWNRLLLCFIFSNYLESHSTCIYVPQGTYLSTGCKFTDNFTSFYPSTHGLNEMPHPVTWHPVSLSPRQPRLPKYTPFK